MRNYLGALFLALEFARDLTILWNMWGLSFVLPGFSSGKVKKWKIPRGMGGGGGVQKSISSTLPLVWIFSGIVHFLSQILTLNARPTHLLASMTQAVRRFEIGVTPETNRPSFCLPINIKTFSCTPDGLFIVYYI